MKNTESAPLADPSMQKHLTDVAEELHLSRTTGVQQVLTDRHIAHSEPGVSLQEGYARMTAFASALPPTFPLHLGEDFGPQARGHMASYMALLDLLMAGHAWDDALQWVDLLEAVLPPATQQAALSCLTRLTRTITIRGDLLTTAVAIPGREVHRSPEGQPTHQRQTAIECAARCVAISDSILALPNDVGSPLVMVLSAIWDRIESIQQGWLASEFPGRDRYQLDVSPAPVLLHRRKPTILTIAVCDEDGHPVVGFPIVWRVTAGSAAPYEPTRNVTNEWASTGADGLASLKLVSRSHGHGEDPTDDDVGIIEVQSLGNPREGVRPHAYVKYVVYRMDNGTEEGMT